MLTAIALLSICIQNNSTLDPAVVWSKLQNRMKTAKGLSYEVQSYQTVAGKEQLMMKATAKAMRPNLLFAESEGQCWYSNGKSYYEFFPKEKEYVQRELDPTGMWLPLAGGLLGFCAPSIYKPHFTRAFNTTYRGKKSVCLEGDDTYAPGMVLKTFLNPTTWLPQGWEQTTADSTYGGYYTNINTETSFTSDSFEWKPPIDAVDMAKVKRISTLLKVGTKAPMLILKDPEGKILDMKTLLKGKKALLLNFWYYDCGYCQKEFPRIKDLYKDKKGKGLEILCINSGTDSISVIKNFLKASKLKNPVAVKGADAAKLYGVQAFPSNFLIDAEGNIVSSSAGFGEESFK